MTPRDRLQRLLFEHRTAHDPASSERRNALKPSAR